MKVSIQGPVLGQPSMGLVASALVASDEGWARGVSGVEYEVEGCDCASLFPPCAPHSKDVPAEGKVQVNTPFGVWAGDRCEAGFGRSEAEMQGRAERRLLADQSRQVESVLWDGNPFAATDPALVQATAVNPGVVYSAEKGLRALLTWLQGQCSGGQLWLHASPGAFDALLQGTTAGTFYREAGLWRWAVNGAVVVPGRGYSGNGPGGAVATATSQWVVVSGPVEVRLSSVSFTSARDHATNDVVVRAERAGLVTVDPCPLGAVEIEVC